MDNESSELSNKGKKIDITSLDKSHDFESSN